MKIKIEHLRHPDSPDGQTVLNTQTRVYDQESGLPIGGIQKVDITFNSQDFFPRASLEVINFETEMVDVDVGNIEVVGYGPGFMKPQEMNHDELIEALKFEGVERWKQNQKLKALKKELRELKKVLDGSNTDA
jgi:hypothetical protein